MPHLLILIPIMFCVVFIKFERPAPILVMISLFLGMLTSGMMIVSGENKTDQIYGGFQLWMLGLLLMVLSAFPMVSMLRVINPPPQKECE